MSDDLVAFLKARLDEDEQAARAATAGPWAALDGGVMSLDNESWPVASTETDQERADRVHIARHDPARVLAEVAAKRRIIDQALRWMALRDGEWGCIHDPDAIAEGLCPEENPSEDTTLRLLASVYAGKPGWRSEWAPDEEENRGNHAV